MTKKFQMPNIIPMKVPIRSLLLVDCTKPFWIQSPINQKGKKGPNLPGRIHQPILPGNPPKIS